jgi:glutathione S-transferase
MVIIGREITVSALREWMAEIGARAKVAVSMMTGKIKTTAQMLNPRGQIPVLEDGELRLWDSLAILVFLARRYGDPERAGGPWLPADAVGEARVMQWLALSENELLYGLARARSVLRFGRPFDLTACQAEGRMGLDVLEVRLQDRDWLEGEVATIADIACYPYAALADEAGVALGPYPAVGAWLERFAALPGYHTMPGVAAG